MVYSAPNAINIGSYPWPDGNQNKRFGRNYVPLALIGEMPSGRGGMQQHNSARCQKLDEFRRHADWGRLIDHAFLDLGTFGHIQSHPFGTGQAQISQRTGTCMILGL